MIKPALQEAIVTCDTYPDIQMEELGACVSKMLGVGREKILFGNGASELFYGNCPCI